MRLLARLSFTLFILFAISYSLLAEKVYAEGEFKVDYDVLYLVVQNGQTQVTQNIVLENKTANYYADMFELKIGSTKVSDVKAQDKTGPIQTNVKFENNLTTISVKFSQKVVGSGKTLPWTLTYTSSELATKSGQIWEISIPRLAKSADIDQYSATVSVPSLFGPVAFTTPTPKSSSKIAQRQGYVFDKEQLTKSGIAMSFGERQVFSYSLTYHLENNNLTSQIDQIALPPDNNYQKVVLEKIDPPPIDVSIDEDGNFLAKYKLSAKQEIDIIVEGSVEVASMPFRKIYKSLTNEQRNLYTQPQRYWETDTALIKDKAKELKTPEEIYNFVTSYLTYSEERLKKPKIERMGALQALNSPKDAVCMEFTDLFIALARAAKIPAREVEGYAYTQNERLRPLSLTLSQGDILHAWPEYWDDKLGWVQIDPTWGSTSGGLNFFDKLDFNHITFIQRGIFSTIPFPAGAYKKQGETSKKDVIVSFTQNLPNATATPQLSLIAPQKIIAAVPVKVEAEVKNIGTTSILDQRLTLTTSRLKNSSPNQIEIPILPPFSKKTYVFNLQTDNYFLKAQDTLILSFADSQITKPVEILPFYRIVFSKNFVASLIVALLIIITGLLLYGKTHSKLREKLDTGKNPKF